MAQAQVSGFEAWCLLEAISNQAVFQKCLKQGEAR